MNGRIPIGSSRKNTIIIIDNFLLNGVNKEEEVVQEFRQFWIPSTLATALEFTDAAAAVQRHQVLNSKYFTIFSIRGTVG